MNNKKLQQKLDKRTQRIIENVPCQRCGQIIHYILNNSDNPTYSEVDTEQQTVIRQDGQSHTGYKIHKCSEDKKDE